MAKKLYVGNLSYDATNDDLNDLFSQYGSIEDIFIVKDKFTGRARGFAFVTITEDDKAEEAIAALAEQEFMGRRLIVNEAQPKEERSGGGGGRGHGGGGGRGGRGGYGGGRGR